MKIFCCVFIKISKVGFGRYYWEFYIFRAAYENMLESNYRPLCSTVQSWWWAHGLIKAQKSFWVRWAQVWTILAEMLSQNLPDCASVFSPMCHSNVSLNPTFSTVGMSNSDNLPLLNEKNHFTFIDLFSFYKENLIYCKSQALLWVDECHHFVIIANM